MDTMAIAAANLQLAASTWQQTAGVALLDKAMDQQESQTKAIMDMMPKTPSFGHKLDIYI